MLCCRQTPPATRSLRPPRSASNLSPRTSHLAPCTPHPPRLAPLCPPPPWLNCAGLGGNAQPPYNPNPPLPTRHVPSLAHLPSAKHMHRGRGGGSPCSRPYLSHACNLPPRYRLSLNNTISTITPSSVLHTHPHSAPQSAQRVIYVPGTGIHVDRIVTVTTQMQNAIHILFFRMHWTVFLLCVSCRS